MEQVSSQGGQIRKEEEPIVPMDEKVVIEIAKNKMLAVISFEEPNNGGRLLELEEILQELRSKGVVYGIDQPAIEEAIATKVYGHRYIAAQGLEPVHGTNAELQFHFDPTPKDIRPPVSEDGSVDFHNLNLIEIVTDGQTLVTMVPPQEGTPGFTVQGIEITPAKGKKVILPKGKNVKISEDGLRLYAGISGQVLFTNDKVNVYPTYEVPVNVDNSTGNIQFIGNVLVKGNVVTGFSIVAGGNVEVMGVVEGAEIRAEGNIILHRGMQGMGKGILLSGGNVIAKYIENSTVIANGNIEAEAVMHSTIKCGERLEVLGKKGLVVGGIIKAGHEVIAKVIGSHMATVTDIEVGNDPTLLERYRGLKSEVQNLIKELQKTEQIIELLNRAKEADKLSDERREMLVKSIRTKVVLSNELVVKQNEVHTIEPQLQGRDDGKVKAHSVVHPGVKVTIGSISMYIREEVKYCTLYKDRAEIRIGSYE